ncbi:MAG: aminotransferase class IV [Verrucomicrobiota bacterium]|nr:aminotransferase class IV [Verrucomicrobiota bacterium]
MIVFFNGQFCPAEQARVSIFDRGFLYGDGLFEAVRVYSGRLFLWEKHLDRLERGAAELNIRIPFNRKDLTGIAHELLGRNKSVEAIMRLQLTRGQGKRGYSPRGAENPTFCVTVHPHVMTDQGKWKLQISRYSFCSRDKTLQVKTSSKIVQVLAKGEAEEAGYDEALFLNHENCVAEASGGNIFWLKGKIMYTPKPDVGLLPGVTRQFVMDLGGELKLKVSEVSAQLETLLKSDGAFLTSTGIEIVPIQEVEGKKMKESPWVNKLIKAYADVVGEFRKTGR